jgi:hypothetical protein
MAAMLELNLDPDERTLRRFGLLALCVFGALGACAWRGMPPLALDPGPLRSALACGLWALAGSAGLLALLWPRGNRALYVGLSLLGYPVGLVVSHAMLALLFFAVFTPVGAGMRLLGRDPLERALERGRASYWTKARGRQPKPSYFRQF